MYFRDLRKTHTHIKNSIETYINLENTWQVRRNTSVSATKIRSTALGFGCECNIWCCIGFTQAGCKTIIGNIPLTEGAGCPYLFFLFFLILCCLYCVKCKHIMIVLIELMDLVCNIRNGQLGKHIFVYTSKWLNLIILLVPPVEF